MLDAPNDCRALTCAHFILGDSLLSIAREDIDIHAGHFNEFKISGSLGAETTSWKSRYEKNGFALNVGVLLAEDHEVALVWKLGTVTKLFEMNDEIPRVAEIKTSKTAFNRPIIKLRKLPLAESMVDRDPQWSLSGEKIEPQYFG